MNIRLYYSVAFFGGVIIGSFVGYGVYVRKVDSVYSILSDEIDELMLENRTLRHKTWLGVVDKEFEEAKSAEQNKYVLLSTAYKPPTKPLLFDKDISSQYVSLNQVKDPVVDIQEISLEQYYQEDIGFDQEELIYWEGDGVLSLARDPFSSLEDPKVLVGEAIEILIRDRRTEVFMRNFEKKTEYQITVAEGSYSENMLGLSGDAYSEEASPLNREGSSSDDETSEHSD